MRNQCHHLLRRLATSTNNNKHQAEGEFGVVTYCWNAKDMGRPGDSAGRTPYQSGSIVGAYHTSAKYHKHLELRGKISTSY